MKNCFAAVVAIAMAGCSQTDLDRCIDSQMAVWEQRQAKYEQEVADFKPPFAENDTVEIGGARVPKNFLVYPRSPGTREEAEARANIKCGTIYSGKA